MSDVMFQRGDHSQALRRLNSGREPGPVCHLHLGSSRWVPITADCGADGVPHLVVFGRWEDKLAVVL